MKEMTFFRPFSRFSGVCPMFHLRMVWNVGTVDSDCAVAQILCVFLKNRFGQLTTFLAGLSYTPVGRVFGSKTKGAFMMTTLNFVLVCGTIVPMGLLYLGLRKDSRTSTSSGK